jgi:hypothetical protein
MKIIQLKTHRLIDGAVRYPGEGPITVPDAVAEAAIEDDAAFEVVEDDDAKAGAAAKKKGK